METWVFTIVISLCITALLKSLYDFFHPKLKLPPGPSAVPFIGRVLWLLKSFSELEPILRNLHAKYGPIVTLHIGSRPAIFVSANSLAYQALIQNGAVFADRPAALAVNEVLSCNRHNITSASYGPTWRLLRRNLAAEILHPSQVRSYSPARRWVLEILTARLQAGSESGEAVRIVDHFQYAMFCLLVLMCFGDKLEEKQIQEIETIQRKRLLSLRSFDILNFWPKVGKVFFRRRWEELYQILKNQEDILLPYIRARQQLKQEILIQRSKHDHHQDGDGDRDDGLQSGSGSGSGSGSSSSSSPLEKKYVLSYVDTLLDLTLPSEENRKLKEGEMVSLCSEFLNAGTDTTSTALQWIMANLVKHPHIQARLFEEISGVVGELGKEEVDEEDLQKMPYLKAVILEGLRRHPPGHLVLPHSVTQDITFEGYLIPKNASINFMVAEMGWNPKIWEDPMEFKPERFLISSRSSKGNGNGDDHEVFDYDITGSREIKMMPFGAGRRICPGYGLAMLHLEYFVANLVYSYEWKGLEGDKVDLSEKQEFTVVMKNPLQVHLSPRRKK